MMAAIPGNSGAGKESRTPDLNLGKVALYQLSYSRIDEAEWYSLRAASVKSLIPRLPEIGAHRRNGTAANFR